MGYDRAAMGASGDSDLLARIRDSEAWSRAYSEPEPLVTVRIATWNRAELLVERALPSVFAQTYPHWEVAIVGDACSDDTEERVAALGDPRIRFQNLPVNGPYPENLMHRWYVAGVPAMNAALRMARGQWIAPLDDDDEWDDDHLEVLLGAALQDRTELVYGRTRCHLHGDLVEQVFGAWPPRRGTIDLGTVLYNAALREFEHDLDSCLVEEPHDWHLVHRMWDAGVSFKFVDRVVATYHLDHAKEVLMAARARRVAKKGANDGADVSDDDPER